MLKEIGLDNAGIIKDLLSFFLVGFLSPSSYIV